ncbi:MAG: metallophosphoesterase family protein, partial [Myxococcales bacterium]|nr:metallophosphoesterase family protein [Myxococcales bacterium]
MAERQHQHVALPLRGDSLRVIAVADTHSRPHPEASARIAALQPDHILHAGDIGDLAVIDDLTRLAPVTAVRGNIDAGVEGVPDVVTLEIADEAGVLIKLLLLHIAVYGPKLRAEAAKLARREGADLVVCGHSHVPFAARDKGL